MIISATSFQGVYTIDCQLYRDDRGWFYESFRQDKLEERLGERIHFVQDNQSFSRHATLRGLHYQSEPYSQTKLVRVLQGEIQDVIVDLRRRSSSYGQYLSIILSSSNRRQLFIPRGFAHGFLVLSDTAEVFYKCDEFYHPSSESGVNHADPILGIKWLLEASSFLVSKKDRQYSGISQI